MSQLRSSHLVLAARCPDLSPLDNEEVSAVACGYKSMRVKHQCLVGTCLVGLAVGGGGTLHNVKLIIQSYQTSCTSKAQHNHVFCLHAGIANTTCRTGARTWMQAAMQLSLLCEFHPGSCTSGAPRRTCVVKRRMPCSLGAESDSCMTHDPWVTR